MRNIFYFLFLSIFLTGMIGCEDDDVAMENEEELITTLLLTLTPNGGGTPVVLQFRDIDGPGGMAATVESPALDAQTTYSGSMTLLNESESPAENITEEVMEEDEDHQVFYIVTDANLDVTYRDMDENLNPIGLATTIVTGDASTGKLRVVLRHEPDKDAAMVSEGDITNAGGESDIDVEFDIQIN